MKSLIKIITKTILPAVLALFLLAGCGPREVSQSSSQPESSEIEIFYHADDEGEPRNGDTELTPQETEKPKETNKPQETDKPSETKRPEDDERIVITLLLAKIEGTKGKYDDFVAQFNRENPKYRVELETCPYGEELQTMRDRLLVEVGTGGGPDLMTEDVFPLSQEIMDSGVLVDLTPYLEKSGITRETCFPGYASAVSGARIYGVDMQPIVINYCLDKEVLGDREVPGDLEGLVDMLLEYQGKGSLIGPTVRGRYVLQYFLQGSEDLWGIIDWENNTCDFTAPIFSKILELTKRGHEDGKKGYGPVLENYPVAFPRSEEESRSDWCSGGTVPVGYFFDDGPHHLYQVNGNTLMINANTENLEGAYAFVSYILSKAGQKLLIEPVNKEAWESVCQFYMSKKKVSEETRKEMLEMYEEARFAPRRAEEVLEIVYEVADGYIEGDRSKEETIELIQNRVRLYLNENN